MELVSTQKRIIQKALVVNASEYESFYGHAMGNSFNFAADPLIPNYVPVLPTVIVTWPEYADQYEESGFLNLPPQLVTIVEEPGRFNELFFNSMFPGYIWGIIIIVFFIVC